MNHPQPIGAGWQMGRWANEAVFMDSHRRVYSLDVALRAGMLREVRQDRGVKQYAVALDVGARVETVSRWECGVTVPRGLYRRRLEEWLANTEREWPMF